MFLFGFPAKTMGCMSKLVLAKAEGRGFGWFVSVRKGIIEWTPEITGETWV